MDRDRLLRWWRWYLAERIREATQGALIEARVILLARGSSTTTGGSPTTMGGREGGLVQEPQGQVEEAEARGGGEAEKAARRGGRPSGTRAQGPDFRL
ncbi:unnamed protein product [Nezara viridula]|uniref:Uncharacterized protein n=1 Tax=Nezara viridula TaxID=85310 RepID=A0A9P0H606_NEZVI|nr:unnamed protein product [Nezara viridula]